MHRSVSILRVRYAYLSMMGPLRFLTAKISMPRTRWPSKISEDTIRNLSTGWSLIAKMQMKLPESSRPQVRTDWWLAGMWTLCCMRIKSLTQRSLLSSSWCRKEAKTTPTTVRRSYHFNTTTVLIDWSLSPNLTSVIYFRLSNLEHNDWDGAQTFEESI